MGYGEGFLNGGVVGYGDSIPEGSYTVTRGKDGTVVSMTAEILNAQPVADTLGARLANEGPSHVFDGVDVEDPYVDSAAFAQPTRTHRVLNFLGLGRGGNQ